MRLSEVDPAAVAGAIVHAAADHLHSIAMRIDPTLVIQIRTDEGAMGLRPTAEALCVYARDGLPVWDWETHVEAEYGLYDVLEALYRSARGGMGRSLVDVPEGDPGDEIDLVLVAAAARVRLARGMLVTARDLAVLGGMTQHRVRQLIHAGELEADTGRPARVDADAASRWLGARGVAGYR